MQEIAAQLSSLPKEKNKEYSHEFQRWKNCRLLNRQKKNQAQEFLLTKHKRMFEENDRARSYTFIIYFPGTYLHLQMPLGKGRCAG